MAVDTHRHFVKAAESCGVTQSTLSSLIKKLEEENEKKKKEDLERKKGVRFDTTLREREEV